MQKSGIMDARIEGESESEQTNHLLDDNSTCKEILYENDVLTKRPNPTTIQYLHRQVYIDSHAKKGGETNGEEWTDG